VPRPHTAMRNVRDVLRLSLGEGLSLRKVSASAAAPFSTVADYVRRAKAAGLSWPLPDDMDDDALEALFFNAATSAPAAQKPVPDWAYVHKELRKKSVTLMLLWLEYKEAHPDGWGYSQFTEHYRRWRQTVDLPMRQEHKAGEKLFVDFPGETLPVYDEKTGEVAMAAELFVAALGASGLVYAEAFPSQELIYWVAAHVHTFEAIGGCPEIVVCDYVPRHIISVLFPARLCGGRRRSPGKVRQICRRRSHNAYSEVSQLRSDSSERQMGLAWDPFEVLGGSHALRAACFAFVFTSA
jgi:transposase